MKTRANHELATAPSAVTSIWNFRHRIELEAADQFQRLGDQLSQIGAKGKVIELAYRAAREEIHHAELCEEIIGATGSNVSRIKPALGVTLGPIDLPLREQTLYACTAIACITETFSTALLIEMKKVATPGIIQDTVHAILIDEISHSRIGWAHLTDEANHYSLGWLAPYLPGMIRDAVAGDDPRDATMATVDLSSYGILPRGKSLEVIGEALVKVVLPGLRSLGIDTRSAEMTMAEFSPLISSPKRRLTRGEGPRTSLYENPPAATSTTPTRFGSSDRLVTLMDQFEHEMADHLVGVSGHGKMVDSPSGK